MLSAFCVWQNGRFFLKKEMCIRDRSIPVNVRVIAASNMPLDMLVEEGKFRRDLFYRLNIMTIKIPPLRERKEDILPLVRSFIGRYNGETLRNVRGISEEAVEYLMNYDWPGNVRELQNLSLLNI